MVAFYITCILFVVVLLGAVRAFLAKLSILKMFKHFAKEYLLNMATFVAERWTHALGQTRAQYVLDGKDPFDYSSIGIDPHDTEFSLPSPPAPINPAHSLTPTPTPVLPPPSDES